MSMGNAILPDLAGGTVNEVTFGMSQRSSQRRSQRQISLSEPLRPVAPIPVAP